MEAAEKFSSLSGGIRGRRVRIFHLFSNYKFTGPADPALLLAESQQNLGHDVSFFCGGSPKGTPSHLADVAKERGLDCHVDLHLSKHFQPTSLLGDVLRLRQRIAEEQPDLLHCHLPGDHLLASLARGSGAQGPRIIKSHYQEEPTRNLRGRYCRTRTDLWISPTPSATRHLSDWQVPPGRIVELPPAVDLTRFLPMKERQSNSEDESIRVAVVARMQRHRLFPELIEGFSRAANEDPRLQLEVFGRGTHQEEVAHLPAHRSGHAHRIHFRGYLEGDRYPEMLSQADILLFLVPGSDGTCRAAREALACGVPVISSRRGLLPELIPSEAGIHLTDESPQSISHALLTLSGDRSLRKSMGFEARRYSEQACNPAEQARSLEISLQRLSGSF